MRVLFTCGREGNYPRNAALQEALSRKVEVVPYTEDRLDCSIPYRSGKLLGRLLATGAWRSSDVIVVGFYGHLLVPVLKRFTAKPILFDPLISTYDTLCLDRRRFKPGSPLGRLALALDRRAFKLADLVLADTRSHADFFIQTLGIPPEKTRVLYLGCPDRDPTEESTKNKKDFTVFTVAGFLPLHGISLILEAARRLPEIQFIVAGQGPLLSQFRREIRETRVSNVRLPGPIPYPELRKHLAGADLCLGGHFSDIPKARRVIANKTFQFLSQGKATIVGDHPANREIFQHGEQVYLVAPEDPEALAQAIRELWISPDLRKKIARRGYLFYRECLGRDAAAEQLYPYIQQLKSISEGRKPIQTGPPPIPR